MVLPTRTLSNLSRRDFLTTGAAAVCASGLASSDGEAAQAEPLRTGRAKHCILLMLTGGPSQLETWDPKPDAPQEIRGPFRPIATSVPGVRISEHFPAVARLAHRYTLVRTVHHDASAVHESGLQLLQTGRISHEPTFPHLGAVLSSHLGPRDSGSAPFVILPEPLGNMGLNVSRGQSAGFLGAAHEGVVEAPFTFRPTLAERERYGKTSFGDACARARRLVETGARCVVVNMFPTVFDRVTWDCHADRQGMRSTLDDYRRMLCPSLDLALAALLTELDERGLLDETLVVALGEMGRTPRLNAHGGRDHWTKCWSILIAGGGIRGGQVVGTSDRQAAEPLDRPVACAEVFATICQAMGIAPTTRLVLPDQRTVPIVEASPVRELF